MSNVRSAAKIDQGAASIDGGLLTDFFVQDSKFELIVLEHFQKVFLFHCQSFKWLLVFDDLLDAIIEDFEITFANLKKGEKSTF